MASEIKVDTISEKTSAGGVTIDGLLIKDGGISGDVSLIGTTPTFTIGDAGTEDATLLFDGNTQNFYIALDDSADDLLIGLGSTVGTTPIIAIDENKLSTFSGAITVGVDDTGHDVKFFGATASAYMLWDESADDLILAGAAGLTVAGATALNGDVTLGGTTPTLTIGDAGTEDVTIVFDGNAQDYHIGLDDSADTLVIGLGSTLGTTTALSIDENQTITQVGSMVKPIVTLVATGSITVAAHAGRILLMGEVGGNAAATFTLPAATGSGAEYRFIVSVVNTSNYKIQVTGDDTIDGSVTLHQDGANTVASFNTASDSDTITLNGTTTGGVSIGDEITLLDMATDQYMVKGILTASGTEETPFTAAVS
tara:strand:+ start:409 stop:1512 length:1104 start_codon:yes stop_codon:yes gene_type:complete